MLTIRATAAEQLSPTDNQKTTLYFLLGYVIFITVGWTLWGVRHILYPWKLFTVASLSTLTHAVVSKFQCANAALTGSSMSSRTRRQGVVP